MCCGEFKEEERKQANSAIKKTISPFGPVQQTEHLTLSINVIDICARLITEQLFMNKINTR